MPRVSFNQAPRDGVMKITNTTNQTVYIASYYVPKLASLVVRVQDPIEIEAGTIAYLQRPEFRLGYDRYLLYADQAIDLPANIQVDDFNKRDPKYIGTLAGVQVYIAQVDGKLQGYNSFEWNFWYPLIFSKKIGGLTKTLVTRYSQRPFGTIRATISKAVEKSIRTRLASFWRTPHIDQVAKVRIGNGLSEGENKALAARQIKIAAQMQKKWGTVDYIPKIGVLFSGGGYRSMSLSLGFLSMAQRIGLLDMITWMSMVSGSTWGVGTLFTSLQYDKDNLTIAHFNEKFAQSLNSKKVSTITLDEIQAINNLLLVQAIEHQAFTSINLAGALLANRLFAFVPPLERQQIYLSQQASLIESGAWPIPIYNAVHYQAAVPAEYYQWVECTPWEIGGAWLGCYAPIWATSRMFNDGVSIDKNIEKSLGYMFGVFGSAFAETVSKLYESFKNKLWPAAKNLVEKVIVAQVGERRLWWAQMYNFSKGVSESPLKDQEYLDLIDAGFTCNIAYPPLSGERTERMPDILIFIDNSTHVDTAMTLSFAEQYARRHDLKMPPINYDHIGEHAISVFKQPDDPSVPVVIYMPRIIDQSLLSRLNEPSFNEYVPWIKGFDLEDCIKKGVCTTLNVVYSYMDIMRLMKLAEFNLLMVQQTIFNEIKEIIDRKSPPKEVNSLFFS